MIVRDPPATDPQGDRAPPPTGGRAQATESRALVGGRIHTMVTPEGTAEAVLWEAGRITLIGRDADVRAAAEEKDIPVQDLGGRVVLPGFVDAHMHFLHVGVKEMRPDLRDAQSLEDALETLRGWLEAHPGDDPVVAEGWDESDWPEGRFPTRQDIDGVTYALGTRRPVVMRRICGHIAVAGSTAVPPLRDKWPQDHLVDPETGLVQEEASLYNNEVFPAPPQMLREAIQIACRTAHRIGVTTVGDYCQAPFREAVLEAAERGDLSVRLFESIYVQQLDDEAAGQGASRGGPGPDRFRTGTPRGAGDWCRDGGLKVFLDGSFGGHTAHMREPYEDKETHGTPIWNAKEVDAFFEKAHRHGIQVHAHAIGDAAIDQGLDGFARLQKTLAAGTVQGLGPYDGAKTAPAAGAAVPAGGPGMGGPLRPGHPGTGPGAAGTDAGGMQDNLLRHRFEHYELPQEDALERTVAMGVWACSQPNFVGEWSAKGGMYEKRIGKRHRLANRFASFQEAGLRFSFGSDGMPFGPLRGLQACIDHPNEAERLPIATAVWYYTHEAARSIHWEDAVGTLEPGKHADLLILDVASLEEKDPKEWIIEETIVAGTTRCRGERPRPAAD